MDDRAELRIAIVEAVTRGAVGRGSHSQGFLDRCCGHTALAAVWSFRCAWFAQRHTSLYLHGRLWCLAIEDIDGDNVVPDMHALGYPAELRWCHESHRLH